MDFFLAELILISILSVLFVLGEFASLFKNKLNWYLIISFVSLTMLSLNGIFFITGLLRNFSFLLGSYIPFIFLLGPFFTLFLRTRLQLSSFKSIWIHLIPAGVSILSLILFHIYNGSFINQILTTPLENLINSKEFPLLGLLNLHFIIYLIIVGFDFFNSIELTSIQNERSLRLTLILLIHTFLISFLLLIGFILRNIKVLEFSLLLLIIFLLLIYLIQRGFPEFFQELEIIIRQTKYKNSRLKRADLSQIQNNLNQLMIEEKIYCEDDISISILAKELGLTIHQLSEYFNHYLKKSFVSYINEFRIKEAQRLLIDEPDTTILAIAYQIGFNSKSAFNAAFLKETGCSPTLFRKKNKK